MSPINILTPRKVLARVSIAALLVAASMASVLAAESRNMRLVGSHDLQGRSAYQPVIHRQGDRWLVYIGLHGGSAVNPVTGRRESNGTAILDVTDPSQPRFVAHIPGDGGGAQMVRVCSGAGLPHADKAKVYLLRTLGNSAHETWDVTDPTRPMRLATIGGLQGTHKNWWECDTGIAYLVSGVPGWRTGRMTQIYDLSNPAKPRFIRNFGLVGQQPGSSGPVPTGLHGPISTGPAGNRVYFGYGVNSGGIVQIVDRQKLLTGAPEPTPANLRAPEVARIPLLSWAGAHTAFPLLRVPVPEFAKDRGGAVHDFVVATAESVASNCGEPRQMVWIIDVTDESTPFGVSTYTPREADGAYCERGGRFGTHSSNESFAPVFYRRVMFFAAFNAGVRAVDFRDPYRPVELGHYVPATTGHTEGRVIQTNNVEVDERGYIYIVDRAGTGLHILELTGDARKLMAAP